MASRATLSGCTYCCDCVGRRRFWPGLNLAVAHRHSHTLIVIPAKAHHCPANLDHAWPESQKLWDVYQIRGAQTRDVDGLSCQTLSSSPRRWGPKLVATNAQFAGVRLGSRLRGNDVVSGIFPRILHVEDCRTAGRHRRATAIGEGGVVANPLALSGREFHARVGSISMVAPPLTLVSGRSKSAVTDAVSTTEKRFIIVCQPSQDGSASHS